MIQLKAIIFCVCIFWISGCNPNISPIVFQVDKIELAPYPNRKDSFINLTISSKEDFLKIYNKEKGVNIYMFCPLVSGNFDNMGEEEYQLHGYFLPDNRDTSLLMNNRYIYKLPISIENKKAQVLSDTKKIISLLPQKECIDCKIVMAFFPNKLVKNYFSETFCISKDSLIKCIR